MSVAGILGLSMKWFFAKPSPKKVREKLVYVITSYSIHYTKLYEKFRPDHKSFPQAIFPVRCIP